MSLRLLCMYKLVLMCSPLLHACIANGFEDLVDVHCAAAGAPDSPGATAEVIEPVFGPGTTKIAQASDDGFSVVKRATVPLVRVSALLPLAPALRLVKIDIEGLEGVVLKELLAARGPVPAPYIYVEVWPDRWAESGVDSQRIFEGLLEAGFRVYRFGGGMTQYTDAALLAADVRKGAIPLFDGGKGKRTQHLRHDILGTHGGWGWWCWWRRMTFILTTCNTFEAVHKSEPEPVLPPQKSVLDCR
jgi:FkbM family methyltransferase